MIKFKELDIADRMMDIVDKEIARIQQETEPDDRSIIRLEKLAKVYATLMANQRENMKHGVFGKLSDDDLQHAVDSEDAGSDDEDASDDVL